MLSSIRNLSDLEFNTLFASVDFKPDKKSGDPIPTYPYAATLFDRVYKEKNQTQG
jgi:hypothetical protein